MAEWTPSSTDVQAAYLVASTVSDNRDYAARYQSALFGPYQDEFQRFLRKEREKVWRNCVDHLEATLGAEMKRAAHADNPYRWAE